MTIERCPEPVNFKELFKDTPGEEYPQKRLYKEKTIFLADKFLVKPSEKLRFTIEQTNSRYPQGFCISLESGYFKIDDDPEKYTSPYNIMLWEDCEVQVFTKKGYFFIKNIWETIVFEEERFDMTGKPKTVKFPEGKPETCFVDGNQWSMGRGNGAAMYSEDIPDGKRYFCNDGDEDGDFDDIIFTVRRIP